MSGAIEEVDLPSPSSCDNAAAARVVPSGDQARLPHAQARSITPSGPGVGVAVFPASTPGIGQWGAGTTPGMVDERGSTEPDGTGTGVTDAGGSEAGEEPAAQAAPRTREPIAATRREGCQVARIVHPC